MAVVEIFQRVTQKFQSQPIATDHQSLLLQSLPFSLYTSVSPSTKSDTSSIEQSDAESTSFRYDEVKMQPHLRLTPSTAQPRKKRAPRVYSRGLIAES